MLDKQQIELIQEFGIIMLPGDIEASTLTDMMYALMIGRKAHPDMPLKLYVCGCGGDATYAFGIIDLIARDKNIHGYLVGSAVSAHALIFASCAKRYVVGKGDIAVHPVSSWMPERNFSSEDFRHNAHRLDMLNIKGLSLLYDSAKVPAKWWEVSAQEVDTQRLKTYYSLSNIHIKVEQRIAVLEIGPCELAKEQARYGIVEVSS